MDQIEFADGFDTPDTVAFGLGAGQLAVVMAGALAAYSLVRSPLPAAVVGSDRAWCSRRSPRGSGGCAIAGRPALDWAVFAARFWMRPRRGTVRWGLRRRPGWRRHRSWPTATTGRRSRRRAR